jgi:biopolymer transport protein ExbD
LTIERLQDELVSAAAKNPELKLAISADTKAPFGQIVKVMDAAKAAKIKVINAFTKQAGKS